MAKHQDRKEKLAEALRANLQKRKEQARAKENQKQNLSDNKNKGKA